MATHETIDEIKSYLEQIRERKKALLSENNARSWDDTNNEIKNLFDSAGLLLEIRPAPGVQTQMDLQRRNFLEEARQCLKLNVQMKNKDNGKQDHPVNRLGYPDTSNRNSTGASSQESRQLQTTGRNATSAKEFALQRSAALRDYEAKFQDINDMTIYLHRLVHQQSVSFEEIDRNAENTAQSSRDATTQLHHAVRNAQKVRRWKWYTSVVLILIVGTIIGVIFGIKTSRQ